MSGCVSEMGLYVLSFVVVQYPSLKTNIFLNLLNILKP